MPGYEAQGAGHQHGRGEAPGLQQERKLESVLAENIWRTIAVPFKEFYCEAGDKKSLCLIILGRGGAVVEEFCLCAGDKMSINIKPATVQVQCL